MEDKSLRILFKALSPISPFYSLLMSIRSDLYDKGLLKAKSIDIPVISVGNITLGGSGKTPFVIMLLNHFIERGLKVGVINRGYGGKAKKWPVVVSDGKSILSNTFEVGDEAIEIAYSNPNAIVVSGPNRYDDAKVCRDLGADIIVMDDGFQHLALKRDLNILLIDANQDIFSERVFPGGYLRESIKAINRANCIVFTKIKENNCASIDDKKIKIYNIINCKEMPMFCCHLVFVGIFDLLDNKIDLMRVNNKDILAFSGIANDSSFLNILEKLNVNIKERLKFPDHYKYDLSALKKICAIANDRSIEYIITTQKDMVKIRELIKLSDMDDLINRIYYIKIINNIDREFWEYIDGVFNF